MHLLFAALALCLSSLSHPCHYRELQGGGVNDQIAVFRRGERASAMKLCNEQRGRDRDDDDDDGVVQLLRMRIVEARRPGGRGPGIT